MDDRRGDRTAELNREVWDRWSDGYQAKHGGPLRDDAAAWGLWRIPEAELGILGDVRGRHVLELGCGAAHWSRELAAVAARVVAVDNSSAQLRHAADAVAGHPVRLVQACAECLPFQQGSFDVVFSDYGGMSWADPADTLPEVARVLVPGGLLAFCTASPFYVLFVDDDGTFHDTPVRSYFGLRRRKVAGAGVDFHRTFGEWLSLFTRHGFVVEDLVELTPPEGSVTTFRDRPADWARRWPMENVWRLRRR